MAKNRKKNASPHDRRLVSFCRKPNATLSGFQADHPNNTFTHGNKSYKLAPVGLLPDSIKRPKVVNISIAKLVSDERRSPNLNIGTVINIIRNMKPDECQLIDSDYGQFAILHESVELIKPAVSPTTDMSVENRRRGTTTVKVNPAPEPTTPVTVEVEAPEVTEQATNNNGPNNQPEVDVAELEVDPKADLTNFQTYRWSAFLSEAMNKDYPITAKDHVINKKGIAIIEYAGRHKPIGFMLPDGLIRGNGIESNGRYPISHVAKIIKNQWAANPLKPAVITIANLRGAPIVMVTMGAALELRRKGLFDKAPEWVHDYLNVAQADITKEEKKRAKLDGIDTSTSKPASIPSTAARPQEPDIAATEPPASEPEAIAPKPVRKVEAPEPAEKDTQAEVVNAMNSVTKALTEAKQTQALVKVNIANANATDIVHVGADEESIQAMEDVISLSETMGAQAPEIVHLDYKPTSMVQSMTAMKMAWDSANNDNSLIILEPEGGQRVAMTRNPDLIQAYEMRF